jgi:3-dehydroquinate synthase
MSISTIDAGGYKVFIGSVFDLLADWIDENSFSKIVIMMDDNTKRYCYPVLKEALPGLTERARLIEVGSGEVHKNLHTCNYLWEKLTFYGTDRNALVINLSGGVLSDMGGFVAATYKRGVKFINLPTTLLSMVDASVGGKLGIDYNGYKNHIGLFTSPQAVFINPVFLKTLPPRELKSGMAEVLKHGLIADKEYFHDVISQLGTGKVDYQGLLERSVRIKNNIVLQDPHEEGLRKVLNFGHTVGHAIESWSFESGERLLHGEAVAYGMMVELLLSVRYSGLPEKEAQQALGFLKSYFGSLGLGSAVLTPILQKMHHDKKNREGKLLFTLLSETGKAVYDVVVDENKVVSAMEEIIVV